MIEISIIVQIREVVGEKRGRIAVGFGKILAEKLVPQKTWCENFFSALRRAMSQRERNLSEIQGFGDRRRPEKPLPLFEEKF